MARLILEVMVCSLVVFISAFFRADLARAALPTSQPANTQPATAATPDKEYVQFDGQTLVMAYEEKHSDQALKEYVPSGEGLDSWNKLASIREMPSHKDPLLLAETMAQVLKKQNPASRSMIQSNKKTGEVILDFITWPPDGAFVEFDVFKFGIGDGGGVVAQQYAVREYKEPVAFVKNLKPLRERLVISMEKQGLTIHKPVAKEPKKDVSNPK